MHKTDRYTLGRPCERCGLIYNSKTNYIPCFETGDTFAKWLKRHDLTVEKCKKLNRV